MKNRGCSYQFEDLTVDCANFTIRKGEDRVPLEPLAFDVLVFLIKNGGRTVEKQELFENVWKDNFVGDNSLTRAIKEIRHALGDDAANPRLIETVPKRGYRFIAPVKNGNTHLGSEGKAAEERPTSPRKPGRFALPFLIVAVISLLGVSIVLGIVGSEYYAEYKTATTPVTSVAVLPFENDPPNSGFDHLSEDLGESITNSLSRVSDLRVLPRDIALSYPDAKEDPQIIGRVLRVRSVLTGKIVEREGTLTIQIRLLDADRKAQLCGRRFTRPTSDMAAVEKEISESVVECFDRGQSTRSN